MSSYPSPPVTFLEKIFEDITSIPPQITLCAGYESGNWRCDAFAEHLLEWLPEFALSLEELNSLSPGNALRFIRKASQLVYQTEKYGRRGEFGEILLHIAIRQIYNSIPAITKIYWKDSVNSTVKGFDSVHVVPNGELLELWLGEVKFYEDGKKAIKEVASEIIAHTKADYLRNEFLLITNKLDKQSPFYEKLSQLLDKNTSLDKIFSQTCIPILVTYDSNAIKVCSKSDDVYKTQLSVEIQNLQDEFNKKSPKGTIPIKLHLFFIPIHTKKEFIKILDSKLKGLQ